MAFPGANYVPRVNSMWQIKHAATWKLFESKFWALQRKTPYHRWKRVAVGNDHYLQRNQRKQFTCHRLYLNMLGKRRMLISLNIENNTTDDYGWFYKIIFLWKKCLMHTTKQRRMYTQFTQEYEEIKDLLPSHTVTHL